MSDTSKNFKAGIAATKKKEESVHGRFDHGAGVIRNALMMRGILGATVEQTGNEGK